MSARWSDPQPGLASQYGFSCPRCDRDRPVGARFVFRRGVPVCVECCGGAEDE